MSDTGTVTPRTEAGDDDDWTPLMELRAYVAGIRGGGVPEVVCQSLIAFGRRIEDDTRARTLAAVEEAVRGDSLIEAVYRSLRKFDEAKRTARNLRMAMNGDGPTIKRGTGRSAQAILVSGAVRADLLDAIASLRKPGQPPAGEGER